MSCEYNFPENQADMSHNDGRKIAMALYGDVVFRSPSVKHASNYRKAEL